MKADAADANPAESNPGANGLSSWAELEQQAS
jgi:hypothetical protein